MSALDAQGEKPMEQDWNCPHCGKPIGKVTFVPSAAANPLPVQWMPLNTAGGAMKTDVIPVTYSK